MRKYWTVLMVAVLLTGCGSETSKARGQFIAGCVQGGGSKSTCACAFDKMEYQYGEQLPGLMLDSSPPAHLMNFTKQSVLICAGRLSEIEQADVRKAESSKAALEVAISEQVKRSIGIDGGSEHVEGRKIIEGYFNADQTTDAVVLYTIEGIGDGNVSAQTLALFFQLDGGYLLKNTIDVSGATNLAHGFDKTAVLTRLSHAPTDADCCPSIQSEEVYTTGSEGLKLR